MKSEHDQALYDYLVSEYNHHFDYEVSYILHRGTQSMTAEAACQAASAVRKRQTR